ncbi:hypothetical protein HDU91_001082 [Kappamyces sp. JEL0680]|nr:hypothetical protein HDU91_001082 [Kappamyces sp. JEL0680]
MEHLNAYHPSVEVVVLTDEPYVYPDLNHVMTPSSFKSPKGIAKYKARALEYFRLHKQLNDYDWCLHLDEESVIDGESLRRCFDLIRYSHHEIGQGLIFYNGAYFWKNWLFSTADSARVASDLTLFNLQYKWFERPVWGVHGSFLMLNGRVENEVTWDMGSLTEDYEFSQHAWRQGFTFGCIHGIVREQSPFTVIDFMKQRRRWYLGIIEIAGVYDTNKLLLYFWVISIFVVAVNMLNIPLLYLVDGEPDPGWVGKRSGSQSVALIYNWCFTYCSYSYVFASFLQDIDYQTPWYHILWHIPASIIMQPFCAFMEVASTPAAQTVMPVDFFGSTGIGSNYVVGYSSSNIAQNEIIAGANFMLQMGYSTFKFRVDCNGNLPLAKLFASYPLK